MTQLAARWALKVGSMRLLLINPNTTVTLTERLAAAARAALPDEVTLTAVTADEGFPYISSRAEAQIAGARLLEIAAVHINAADAVIVGAFGDPGLHALRELFDIPVTGMTEAAMLAACSLGDRFAFVTFSPRLAPWFRAQVVQTGLEARFAGVRATDRAFGDVATVAETLRDAILEQVRLAAEQDGADVVILAGAPLAGMAAGLAQDAPAVLIDPISAAALQAWTLAHLAPRGASRGSFARPPAKLGSGMSPPLAGWIARKR